MIPRKNLENEELNSSNYCLFQEDSPKKDNNNSSNKKRKKLENPKTTIIKNRKIFNAELNQIKDIDIDINNINIFNKDNNDTFNNFKLFEDSHRGNKKANIESINNRDNDNFEYKLNFNYNNNKNNLSKNINPYFSKDKNDDIENDNKNKNIYNNIININNHFNNNIVNINSIDNKNQTNQYNKKKDSEKDNNYKINNNINFIKDDDDIYFGQEDKLDINFNKFQINKNNISDKNNINKENKKFCNFNKNIKLDLQNDIQHKNEIEKFGEEMKIMNNKNINKFNKSFIFSNSKSPLKQRESEEEKREREFKEKERNDIRDKLKCYLCFGKINKARLCLNCQKIACENCVKNMLLKHSKCLNCKKPSTLNDIILLPFMDDITNFFINIENNQNQNKQKENQRNVIIDEDDKEENIKIYNNIDIKNVDNIEKNKKRCPEHNDKYIEYYCFQCGENLCPKCLLFFKQSVIEKHKDHTIASLSDLKNYNIKDAIEEYNKLKNSKEELNELFLECQLKLKKLTIKKEIALKNLEETKKETELNFMEKINLLKDLSKNIESKKEVLENSIDSVPNSFINIINQKDLIQGKQILKELKKLNSQLKSFEDLNPRKEENKTNIYFETFESDEINLKLPQNGQYLEELNICNKKINLMNEHECRLKMDLLGGNLVCTLSIKIDSNYYNKYHPMFRGYLMLINSDKRCEYSNFFGNIYTNGVQILSVELVYESIKKIIGEKNEFKIICSVDKIYYK